MKVLHLEHAGRSGPNIVFAQTAAQRPRSEGSPELRRSVRRSSHPRGLNGASFLLGGLRRSFAASPWYKS